MRRASAMPLQHKTTRRGSFPTSPDFTRSKPLGCGKTQRTLSSRVLEGWNLPKFSAVLGLWVEDMPWGFPLLSLPLLCFCALCPFKFVNLGLSTLSFMKDMFFSHFTPRSKGGILALSISCKLKCFVLWPDITSVPLGLTVIVWEEWVLVPVTTPHFLIVHLQSKHFGSTLDQGECSERQHSLISPEERRVLERPWS